MVRIADQSLNVKADRNSRIVLIRSRNNRRPARSKGGTAIMTAINISISMFTPKPDKIAMKPPVDPVVATSTDPFLSVRVP